MRTLPSIFPRRSLKAKKFGGYCLSMTNMHSDDLTGSQLKAWRESHGLTHTTTRGANEGDANDNSELGGRLGLVPTTASMAASVWDARLKQENPFRGPVTLTTRTGRCSSILTALDVALP